VGAAVLVLVVVVVLPLSPLLLLLLPLPRPLLAGALLCVRVPAEVVAVVVAAIRLPLRLLLRLLLVFLLTGVIILSCLVVVLAHRARLGLRWTRLTWNLRCCERLGR
jgi:hypothetical protein